MLAGLMSRFLAWLIDPLIVIALVVALGCRGHARWCWRFPGFGTALCFVVYFLVDWGYGIVLETVWSRPDGGQAALWACGSSRRAACASASTTRPCATWRARWTASRAMLFGLGSTSWAARRRCFSRLAAAAGRHARRHGRGPRAPPQAPRLASAAPTASPPLLRRPRLPRARRAAHRRRAGAADLRAALRREELGMEARLKLFAALSHRLQDELLHRKPPHLSDEKLVLLGGLPPLVSEQAESAPRARAQKYAAVPTVASPGDVRGPVEHPVQVELRPRPERDLRPPASVEPGRRRPAPT